MGELELEAHVLDQAELEVGGERQGGLAHMTHHCQIWCEFTAEDSKAWVVNVKLVYNKTLAERRMLRL